MLESISSALAGISLVQLAIIACMALFASVVGGVSGYGTGALMPLVLVPILGPEPVVPIVATSALFNNTGRATAFRTSIDWKRVLIVLPIALPTVVLGAWAYTMLSGRGAAILIGTVLMASVPARRILRNRGFSLTDRGLGTVSVGFGVMAGGTSGAGIMLLSMLMAAGLQGTAVIATDAVISLGVGITKVATFGFAGVFHAREIAVAILMGTMAIPGAFVARALVSRLPVRVHTVILDVVVIAGGSVMIGAAFVS
jgi:uncharacterized membrane protein YfcA